jgi:hypothetical protein
MFATCVAPTKYDWFVGAATQVAKPKSNLFIIFEALHSRPFIHAAVYVARAVAPRRRQHATLHLAPSALVIIHTHDLESDNADFGTDGIRYPRC